MSAEPGGGQLRRKLWERLKDKSFAEQMLADERLRVQEQRERAEILAQLPDFAGGCVVDVGAGVGRFTAEFAPRARRVVAVDLLQHALDKNRSRNAAHANVEYVCADAMSLRLEARAVDLVFSSWLLMYLSDDEVARFLARCREWLAPGGHLFFKESCETNVLGYGAFRLAFVGVVQKWTGLKINKHVVTAPTWAEIWRWLTRRKGEQSIYYRKAEHYDRLFAAGFATVRRGHVKVFEELYGHQRQRYWLLTPKD